MIASTVYDIFCISQKSKPATVSDSTLNYFDCNSTFCSITETKNDVLIAFSVYTNSSKILASERSRSPNVLNCLHGIRALSTLWILYCHTHTLLAIAPITNMSYVQEVSRTIDRRSLISIFIFSLICCLAVDYTISKHAGSVGSYCRWHILFHERHAADVVITQAVTKNVSSPNSLHFTMFITILFYYQINRNGQLNFALLYIHRYLRLTPLLAACILIAIYIFKHLGDGPLWQLFNRIGVEDNCRSHWWSTLLYIQNYYNSNSMVSFVILFFCRTIKLIDFPENRLWFRPVLWLYVCCVYVSSVSVIRGICLWICNCSSHRHHSSICCIATSIKHWQFR